MINFKQLQEEFHSYDTERERLIKKSRDVLKLSKQLIYALHRQDLEQAKNLLADLEKAKAVIDEIATQHDKLAFEGSYKVALQEYAEAALYYSFVTTGDFAQLDLSAEHFVLGLADLPGELVRRAVYLAGKGQVADVEKIRDAVDKIYGELLAFDFRQNEIRRKVDGIKYDLRKLEDLVLDLTLKRR